MPNWHDIAPIQLSYMLGKLTLTMPQPGPAMDHLSLSLHAHLRRTPRFVLPELTKWFPEALLDCHDHQVTELLEAEVSSKLGKEAGLWFPTGKMAQQVALRLHADARQTRTFVGHPMTHVATWEEHGYAVVHNLVFKPVGDRNELVTLSDFQSVNDDVAVATWELPQRDIGGQLPTWEALTAQVAWAKTQGAATHCDGARIWQCGDFYQRDLSEIASLFDSVYVSLYKDLEAPRGAVLTGSHSFIRAARLWRRRLGGEIPDAWLLTAPALMGLQRLLPRMDTFMNHARAISEAIVGSGIGIVVPYPIHTQLFHVHVPIPIAAARTSYSRLRAETGIQLLNYLRSNADPSRCSFEVAVGENALQITPDDIVELIKKLISRCQ